MNRKAFFSAAVAAILALLLTSGAAWANFYAVGVGTPKIHKDDVVELEGNIPLSNTSAQNTYKIEPDGSVGSAYSVPSGKRLVIVTVILNVDPISTAAHECRLRQGGSYYKTVWRLSGGDSKTINYMPGLVIGPGESVQLITSLANPQNLNVRMYGYLIDD